MQIRRTESFLRGEEGTGMSIEGKSEMRTIVRHRRLGMLQMIYGMKWSDQMWKESDCKGARRSMPSRDAGNFFLCGITNEFSIRISNPVNSACFHLNSDSDSDFELDSVADLVWRWSLQFKLLHYIWCYLLLSLVPLRCEPRSEASALTRSLIRLPRRELRLQPPYWWNEPGRCWGFELRTNHCLDTRTLLPHPSISNRIQSSGQPPLIPQRFWV